jgi:ABC-type Mn2+/Zn2+ transport system permease subunit
VIGSIAEPLGFAFFVRALGAGVLVGALCGSLSTFVVLRRMSYVGHGLAHAVLGGVGIGLALGLDLYLGAALATVTSALLIARVARRPGLHADAAIGIVTTAVFAAGVAALSLVPSRISVEALLFGSILGVGRVDLAVAGGVALVFAAVLFLRYKAIVFATFDPDVAAVQGVPVARVEVVFHLLTAAVVVASVRVLGALLIAAAVVIPAATARLATRSLGTMLALATVLGVAASVVGLYGSYHLDVPSGPSIVLAGAAGFTVVFAVTGARSRLGLARARLAARPVR